MDDDESAVARDADAACKICAGLGWHWGWEAIFSGRLRRRVRTGDPVRLRCPCVDIARQRRAESQKESHE